MEMSFFNFKGVYPRWTLPPSGKKLAERVDSFRHQQDSALARERSLHIEAATAQLETLRLLELEREKKATAGLARFVDHHRQLVSAGPESGGGGARGVDAAHHSNEASGDFGSFGSSLHDGLHLPPVHFAESTHSFAPPPHLFSHALGGGRNNVGSGHASPPSQYTAHNSPGAPGSTHMHYADAGLSMELRGLLNGSTLVDPYASQQSFTGSLVPMEDSSSDMRADQQYFLLDRYHSERVDDGRNNDEMPMARGDERM